MVFIYFSKPNSTLMVANTKPPRDHGTLYVWEKRTEVRRKKKSATGNESTFIKLRLGQLNVFTNSRKNILQSTQPPLSQSFILGLRYVYFGEVWGDSILNFPHFFFPKFLSMSHWFSFSSTSST